MSSPGWMSSGACVHADPELFFPGSRDAAGYVQAGEAKAVCAGCPVRGECLAYALATRQKYGVWGGASEEERRTMTRRNHRVGSPVSHRRPGLRRRAGL